MSTEPNHVKLSHAHPPNYTGYLCCASGTLNVKKYNALYREQRDQFSHNTKGNRGDIAAMLHQS